MSDLSERSPEFDSSTSSDMIMIENHFYCPSPEDDSNNGNVNGNRGLFNVGRGTEETTAVIRRRIRNTWNNAKYNNGVSRWILKQRSSFDQEQPVWLLGKLYVCANNDLTANFGNSSVDGHAYADAFSADFVSRIWFTYRKDFTKLNGCRLKSDCGWGCMLRCGQMILAQGIVCHILGRDWIQTDDRSDERKRNCHRQIVEWFLDCPKRPFSLHRFVELGLQYGKRGGDWYGPASTALILRDALADRHCTPNNNNALLDNLGVFVASDGVLYLDELQLCLGRRRHSSSSLPDARSDDGLFVLPKSLLLIVPVRLGADKFNPLYVYHLKTVLSLKSCIGILGGRPKHSMYFVGWQGDSLIYLDPHYCQNAVDPERLTDFSLQTFHCKWPKKIPISDIDPSCAVGFYLRTGTDLADFFSELVDIVEYGERKTAPVKFPLFSVMKQRDTMEGRTGGGADDKIVYLDNAGRRRRNSSAASKREYVFL